MLLDSLPNLKSIKNVWLNTFQLVETLVETNRLHNLTELKLILADPQFTNLSERLWQSILEKCSNLKKLGVEGNLCFLSTGLYTFGQPHSSRRVFSSTRLTHLSLCRLEIVADCLPMFADLSCLVEFHMTEVRFLGGGGSEALNILLIALSKTPLKVLRLTTQIFEASLVYTILKTINVDWLRVDCAAAKNRRVSEMALKDFCKQVNEEFPTSPFYVRVAGLHNVNGDIMTTDQVTCFSYNMRSKWLI